MLNYRINIYMANMYKGFSTVGRTKKYRLTDQDLIKQDLINHFYIRKGEKLMNPNFGTIIWNVLFEPMTDDLKAVIIADIKQVASYDPRLSIDNVVVTEFEQGIQVELQLRYVETNQINVMNLRFDGANNTLTTA
jgi:phage baseplate assembly protein W